VADAREVDGIGVRNDLATVKGKGELAAWFVRGRKGAVEPSPQA
jgi:hypothetical protein